MKLFQRQYIPYYLFCLFLILLAIGKYYHEPWRDEFHSLCISLAAKNPFDLYTVKQYEGHPYLYYFLLYLTQLFGRNYLAFILLHYVASGLMMYMLLSKFSLHWTVKILLPLNYYFLFEFGSFNRSYVFVFLFLILAAYYFTKEIPNVWASMILVFLAALTHIQALPICFGLGLYFTVSQYRSHSVTLHKAMMLFGLLLGMMALSYYSSIPPDDCYNRILNYIPDFSANILGVMKKVNYGNLTLFDWNEFQFWNVPLFQNGLPHIIIFVIFLAGSIWLFDKSLRYYYILTLLGIMFMLFILNTWGYRHFSFAWISFFIFYLLHKNYKKKWSIAFVLIWLIPQAVSGSIAFYKDIKYVFSNCSSTAKVLRDLNPNVPVAGYLDFTLDGITYLTGKPMYYLGTESLETYTVFKGGNGFDLSDSNRLNQSLRSYLQKYGKGYLLIHKTDGTLFARQSLLNSKTFHIREIYSSPQPSLIHDENYVLFSIE